MLTTHGRAGGRGRSWLIAPLIVASLVLVDAIGPEARACHITHHKATTTATTATATTPTVSTLTPAQQLQEAYQKLLKALPAQTPTVVTPSITPTASTTPIALPQIITATPTSITPTVANWHQTTPTNCMPPTPPATGSTSPTQSQGQTITPAPLGPPGDLLTPPTAAPEPSTLAIAGLLGGAFVWAKRRKSRNQGR